MTEPQRTGAPPTNAQDYYNSAIGLQPRGFEAVYRMKRDRAYANVSYSSPAHKLAWNAGYTIIKGLTLAPSNVLLSRRATACHGASTRANGRRSPPA